MNRIRKSLCAYLGIHDWRFASPKDIPGEGVSRASCPWCGKRKVTEPFNR